MRAARFSINVLTATAADEQSHPTRGVEAKGEVIGVGRPPAHGASRSGRAVPGPPAYAKFVSRLIQFSHFRPSGCMAAQTACAFTSSSSFASLCTFSLCALRSLPPSPVCVYISDASATTSLHCGLFHSRRRSEFDDR